MLDASVSSDRSAFKKTPLSEVIGLRELVAARDIRASTRLKIRRGSRISWASGAEKIEQARGGERGELTGTLRLRDGEAVTPSIIDSILTTAQLLAVIG